MTRTLFGHFAVFNEWTEIDSWEGRFLERIAPGAFDQTIKDRRGRIRALFDHGRDPQVGNKPLGKIVDLREDERGAYFEVSLLDVPYNREFIEPAGDAGLLGASFRFTVPDAGETWVQPKRPTASNPDMLPERTIRRAELQEFGPVVFPAYEAASVGVRSAGTPRHRTRGERQRYARTAYVTRNRITTVEQPVVQRPAGRAEQFEARAAAVRLGRRHCHTSDQRRASLRRERELLKAAERALLGRSTSHPSGVAIRDGGPLAIR